jgi:hypothetical protein
MHPIKTSSKLRNKKYGLGAQKGYRAWYHSTDAPGFGGIEPPKPVGHWKKLENCTHNQLLWTR